MGLEKNLWTLIVTANKEKTHAMKKYILYGTGLEGERFLYRHAYMKDDIDMNCRMNILFPNVKGMQGGSNSEFCRVSTVDVSHAGRT